MSILITGATGTFGRAFLRRVLQPGNTYGRVVAFSRDEVKQAQLYDEFGHAPGFKLFLGDVRDSQRLGMALRGVDTVVHAAALKRVDAGAYSPSEMVATNVLGTMNVVNAAIQNGVQRVIVVSSDKAVNPTNIYGASKYLAECYGVQANAYGYPTGTRIAAVRYGNILGSRGSVVYVWREQLRQGKAPTVTDARMTRFVMTIEHAVELVLFALANMQGGEVFLPKLPSATINDLLVAALPGYDGDVTYTGLRPGGEKMAESLLNEEEPCRTTDYSGYYIITPSHHDWTAEPHWPGKLVAPDFQYRSDTNPWFATVATLSSLIATTEAFR